LGAQAPRKKSDTGRRLLICLRKSFCLRQSAEEVVFSTGRVRGATKIRSVAATARRNPVPLLPLSAENPFRYYRRKSTGRTDTAEDLEKSRRERTPQKSRPDGDKKRTRSVYVERV